MPPTEPTADTGLYLGLISGTSADGIDAALVRFEGQGRPTIIAARTFAYQPSLLEEILSLSQMGDLVSLDRIAQLDHCIGAAFAHASSALIDMAGIELSAVAAIGSHGQTLRHAPTGAMPFTWQMGDPNLIAERTGVTTVADFRRRDVAAGGQGAPLMPAFHRAMLTASDEDVAVLNLGGIANLTVLPRDGAVIGFDTGPANGLMDAWILEHHGKRFDAAGAFAASGNVHLPLLEALLSDSYFALPPPKSTGRDHFHLDWLQQRIGNWRIDAADIQTTLLELSARSIAEATEAHLPNVARVLVCGGGVHNPVLMARLSARLPGVRVESTAQIGIDPDFVEAAGFAWLARQTLKGLAGNLPEVTGARGLRVLGAIHPA